MAKGPRRQVSGERVGVFLKSEFLKTSSDFDEDDILLPHRCFPHQGRHSPQSVGSPGDGNFSRGRKGCGRMCPVGEPTWDSAPKGCEGPSEPAVTFSVRQGPSQLLPAPRAKTGQRNRSGERPGLGRELAATRSIARPAPSSRGRLPRGTAELHLDRILAELEIVPRSAVNPR